jgi:hypothetical protein
MLTEVMRSEASPVTKVALVIGGVAAGFCLLAEVLLGGVLAYGYVTPWPPNWAGVAFAITFALLGPAVVIAVARHERRAPASATTRARRIEVVGIVVGLTVTVFLVFVIAALSVI